MILWDNTKQTVELRSIVESGVNIWDFDYPSFYQGDEKKRFEKKVIDHFYFRQIGQETVGRFLHVFRSRINDIMPWYVKLYETIKIMDGLEDPFGNLDVTETFEQETTGTSESTSDSRNEKRFSNTPQGSIDNLDDYLTEATVDDGNQSDTGSTTGTMKYTHHRKGNQGVNTYAHDMLEYRETLVNIDLMIMNELEDLFLLLY